MGKALNYTREDLINLMKDYVSKYGIPTHRDYDKYREERGYPSSWLYRKEFGKFCNVFEFCGIELDEKKKILCNRKKLSKEELLNYLKIETENKLNNGGIYLLTLQELKNNKSMPSSSIYI